jgi:hypothetical protein
MKKYLAISVLIVYSTFLFLSPASALSLKNISPSPSAADLELKTAIDPSLLRTTDTSDEPTRVIATSTYIGDDGTDQEEVEPGIDQPAEELEQSDGQIAEGPGPVGGQIDNTPSFDAKKDEEEKAGSQDEMAKNSEKESAAI